MRTIIFHDEVTHNTIRELIEQIEQHADKKHLTPKRKAKENKKDTSRKLTIYFTTNGGHAAAASVLIDYIGKLRPYLDIELIAASYVSSCGFDIFFKSDCKKRIIRDTYSVLHLASRYLYTNDMLDKKSEDRFLYRILQDENKRDLEYYQKIGITREEIIRMKRGKDIYFDNNRLQEILEASNEYLKNQRKRHKKSILFNDSKKMEGQINPFDDTKPEESSDIQ